MEGRSVALSWCGSIRVSTTARFWIALALTALLVAVIAAAVRLAQECAFDRGGRRR
jgi:hypothetical protein